VGRAGVVAQKTGPRQADRVVSPAGGGISRACRGRLQAMICDRPEHVDLHDRLSPSRPGSPGRSWKRRALGTRGQAKRAVKTRTG